MIGPRLSVLVPLLFLSSAAWAAAAEEAFLVSGLRQLEFQGEAPTAEELSRLPMDWRTSRESLWLEQGEGVLFDANRFRSNQDDWNTFDGPAIAIRGERGATVRGVVVVPGAEGAEPKEHSFQAKLTATEDRQRRAFWMAWREHYNRMLSLDRPGSAWFRHQVRRADEALGRETSQQQQRNRRFFGGRSSSAEDTFALMSGGRALSENLQLDRQMPITGRDGGAVDISSLSGITVREFNWEALIQGLSPEADPLATLIPHDQHAVFVPSFDALITLADNADEHGTPLLNMAEPRSEDALTRERYERQLCLSLNSVARAIGPQLIGSLALTGGDAYLRTGADVAVLMETPQPAVLVKFIQGQQALVAREHDDAARIQGEIDGVAYSGYRTGARRICSYVAQVGPAVVVTNSTAQLTRLIAVSKKQAESLAETPEYTFFRQRYPRGAENESGLVIISDATIRRWCGPKWRIAASRRTRIAAVMAEMQAMNLSDMVTGGLERRQVRSDFPLARGEQFTLSSGGIQSEAYGDLEFQTPIIELELLRVTPEEAQMYRRWRDGYQRNWSRYFDPIAVRFGIDNKQVSADVTVMPLIDNSRYDRMIGFSQGAELTGAVGDPHPEAVLQWSMALNPDSAELKQYTNLLNALAPQIRVDPLSWVGDGVSVYVDRDPLFLEAAKADDPEEFFEKNVHRMPVALHVECRDGLKLALFMTGLRGFIEQTVPGMSIWESKTHNDEPYVAVTATDRSGLNDEDRQFALYYAASGEGLTLSLNEQVIHRALDRRAARRKAAKDPEAEVDPAGNARWEGQNVTLKVSPEGLDLFQRIWGSSYQRELQRLSHANITILNEWKRMFPELDPVEVHASFWQRRLYCPGGGEYVWNDKLKTMESTAYGSPVSPRTDGPSVPKSFAEFSSGEFGLTFEEDGLRARMLLQRK